MNATRSITTGSGRIRSANRRLFSTVLLVLLGTMLLPSPASAAEGDLSVSCSALVPGTTVDCRGYQSEPEPPHLLRVTLRTAQPPGETVLLEDPSPEWEDHEVWFSFDLPATARAGDEILVHLRNAADDFEGDDVLVVPDWVHDAEGKLWLSCSELVPGTTIRCRARQEGTDQPVVRVTLRSVQPPGETVLFDQEHVEWRKHDVWFSFELPAAARAGDEVLVQELSSVGVDLVLVVPGAEPAEPEPEPTEPSPSPNPSPEPTTEPTEPTEPAPVPSEPADVADTTTAIEELPHTGPMTLPVLLVVGLALVGAGVAVLARGRPSAR